MQVEDRRFASQGPGPKACGTQSTLEIDILASPPLELFFEAVDPEKIGHPCRGIAAPQAAASLRHDSPERHHRTEAYRGTPNATRSGLGQ
jgi:hypothetical protein